jgi:DNA invertase Pin-like site-specific DNA recombinase
MQLAALKNAGCKTVFKDEVNGAHVKRPTRCLKTLQSGDTLVVWKLGRSVRDLVTMLDDFKTSSSRASSSGH